MPRHRRMCRSVSPGEKCAHQSTRHIPIEAAREFGYPQAYDVCNTCGMLSIEQPPAAQLLCLDCQADVSPTPFNGLGWLYCVLARHRVEVTPANTYLGLEVFESLVDQVLLRAVCRRTS